MWRTLASMIGNFKGWEWIIILVLALVLFGGAKKLPEAARGLGRSLRIFKAETKGLVNDDATPGATDADEQRATEHVVLPGTVASAPDAVPVPTAGTGTAANRGPAQS